VDFEKRKRNQESVFSKKMKAGKRRTYFFDVKKTRGEDFYITLTESTRKHDGDGYERHKIFIYKEDFNRFLSFLEETVDHVKTNLLPDFDYESFEHQDDDYDDNQSYSKPYKPKYEDRKPSSKPPSKPSYKQDDFDETFNKPDDDDLTW